MDFIEYANTWAKNELTQGKIMIGIGILFLFAFIGILRSQNELLRGSLIPMGLLLIILIGYGSYILYSRPAHVKQSIALYNDNPHEAYKAEKEKHIDDNKLGNSLTKFYPILLLLAVVGFWLAPSPYYKGMALGFALLFMSAFIIDNGFITRSNSFIAFLDTLN